VTRRWRSPEHRRDPRDVQPHARRPSLGIPYCTLCGSAQAYRTDDAVTAGGADEVPVLRTSGLLSRSNKVMYDLRTESVFDTFTGAAVSGPLQDAGVVLEETTVVRTTWGEWKAAHPDTTIIAEDGGVGRSYPSIRSAAATTTARSSRSARPTTASACRNSWSG
jgi:hypothetical protein